MAYRFEAVETMTLAGKSVTADQVRGTIDLIRRLGGTDRKRLASLINTAINRKAGIPDVACRKQGPDHQGGLMRDAMRLRDIKMRIRVYQFETAEVRARFGHLLADRND